MNLLKNVQFLKLWGNQILLQTSFNMSNFTILLLIDRLTSSRFALAQFYAVLTIPSFLVGLIAGAIVDTSNRKWVILVSDAVLAILFFAYAFFTNNYWLLLVTAFFTACVSQVFTPAESATIPKIVSKKDLNQANSLFLFTGFGAVLAGYGAAGPLIQLFGGLEKYGDQSTFIVAGILTLIGLLLSSTLNLGKGGIRGFHPHLFQEAKRLTGEMLLVAKQNSNIFIPIILLTLMQFCIGLMAILFIDFVKIYLKLPSTATSYFLIAPLGAGLAVGTILLNKLSKKIKSGEMIFIGAFAFGFSMFTVGIAGDNLSGNPNLIILLRFLTGVGAFITGISAVFIAVTARTLLINSTPSNMLGRVFALVYATGSLVTPIPIMLIALLTEKLDVAIVFVLFGTFFTIFAQIFRSVLYKKLA